MPVTRYLSLSETPFDEREFTLLWLIALSTYGVGDIVTTVSILSFVERIEEANVLIGTATALYGQWGLIVPKLVAFFTCLGVSLYGAQAHDKFLYYLPPVALSVLGAFATAYNLRLFVG